MDKYIYFDQIESNWKLIFSHVFGEKYKNVEFPNELNEIILIIDYIPSTNKRHIYYGSNSKENINKLNITMNNNNGLMIFYRFVHCNIIHYKFINIGRIENYSKEYKTFKICFNYLNSDNKINMLKKQLNN
jgi:hypothetical protein